jgi:hypothetical protein
MMMDAELLFNNAFMRTADGWGTILSFRLVVEAGRPAAAARYSETVRAIAHGELPAGDIFRGLPPEAVEWLVRGMTEHTTNTAINSVDAASFVFMHSLLDALARVAAHEGRSGLPRVRARECFSDSPPRRICVRVRPRTP